jgi:protein ImuB
MLWLAIHLPALSLEAFCATLPAGHGARPVVLVADHHVVAANAAALALSIRPGLKRATALALCADVLLAQADAARDAAALQAVVHVALAFTPSVTLDGAVPAVTTCATVLMEVQASLRLFGGRATLLQRLQAALLPLGHRVQIACAPTALGAALLARWRDDPICGQLGSLTDGPHTTRLSALQALLGGAPLALLDAGREHSDTLQGMGLHTLGDLRRLPRDGLARRFGAGLLDQIDRACGRRPDPRRWLTLPDRFDSRIELFARADTSEQVLAGAALLLARLVAWAQAQQARIGGFTLHMQHEPRHRDAPGDPSGGAPHTTLPVLLAAPSLDAAHLQLLLRERLAHCPLAAPTLELRIECRQLVRAPAPNGELFPTRHSESEGLLRLLERLRARLGDARVLCLQPRADHRPEYASPAVPTAGVALAAPPPRRRAAGSAMSSSSRVDGAGGTAAEALPAPAGSAETHPSALPLHRPVWLLPEPLPLAEQRSLPWLDGRPLLLLSGPERIEAGWWDGALAARDYFIAQAADGSLVWVYRARLPPAETLSPAAGWFLQGRFG